MPRRSIRPSKFPYDPEGGNAQRSLEARKTLIHFRRMTGADREDAIYFLIAHLMHLCDRDPRYGEFEFELARGMRSYREETLPDHLYARLWSSPSKASRQ